MQKKMVDLNISLPENFFDEEERCGFVVTRQRKEIWAVELDLLAEFSRVCEKHGIKWFLDGGSILGAVRHKGFIPWDDDIDISMPRNEFEKLCELAPEEFRYPYFFQTYDSDPGYHRMHAQFRNCKTTGIRKSEWPKYNFNQGIFIDIFPFDNVPDGAEERTEFGREIISLYEKMWFHLDYSRDYRPLADNRLIKRIKHSLKHLLVTIIFDRPDRFINLIQSISNEMRKFDCSESECFANLSLPYQTFSHGNYFYKKWYSHCEMMPFEMFNVPVPVGYKDYLATLYGKWEVPIKSESQHGDTFFDVNRSYSDYLFLEGRDLI